jgi:hypothetical protein
MLPSMAIPGLVLGNTLLARDRLFKIPLSQLTAIAIFPIFIAIAFFKFYYPN